MSTEFLSTLSEQKTIIANALSPVPHHRQGAIEAIDDCKGKTPAEIICLLEAHQRDLARETERGGRYGNCQILHGYCATMRWVLRHCEQAA